MVSFTRFASTMTIGTGTNHGRIVSELRPVERRDEGVESKSGDLSKDSGDPDGIGSDPGDPVEVRESLEESPGL
jgi:hypothetical protein